MKVTCPDCGYTWVNEWGLARHRAKPHLRCPDCGVLRVGLRQHVSHVHSGTRKPKSEPKRYDR